MPTAAELLKAKVDGLTTIPDSWVNRVTGIQPKIAARLTRLMAKLTTTNGVVDQTGANLRTVTAILEDLRAYMTQGEYATIVSELNKDFIGQQATSTAYMTTLGGQGIETTFAAQTYAARRAQLVGQLVNGIDEAVLNPVFETLLTGIETKASYSDLLVSVTDSIVGTPNYDGRLLAYSRQLVTDTIGVTDRAFTEIIAADLGLEWYRYTGGLMDTTRCFCEKRNGKWYHKKEIESWGNKENLGECNTGKGWAGMNRATDSSTIFAYAGGYNCQHSILPVSEAAVPTATLKEAIAKGFYKPSANTRKLLGI